VREDMEVEDIVSETLIDLWQYLKKESFEFPKTLLFKMLKNNTLDYLKHRNIRQNAMKTLSEQIVYDLNHRIQTLEAYDPKEIFSSEIMVIIETTLQSLPDQTRRIFELSRFECLSVKEIAEKLSLSPKSIEYHITKSLKALRIALKDYLPLFYFLCFGV
jgi:RNA polymerase sigma-70 factor (ECF subfamily)